jgi:FRG domain-containing protein
MAWVEFRPRHGDASTKVRELIWAMFGLHSTFKDEVWLWRGEADAGHTLEPGMHTRLRNSGAAIMRSEASVRTATVRLIDRARRLDLDRTDGVSLPDLALLASMQHHGAATPLMDVTVDPLVALWMAANSAGDNVDEEDDRAGRLIAIRRPPPRRWLDAFDARSYSESEGNSIVDMLGHGLHWYRPPEISERLRIQRGSFVLGDYRFPNGLTTLPLKIEPNTGDEHWLHTRISHIGTTGRPTRAATEAVLFRVVPALKPRIREWLEDRAGLSRNVMFPTPWHRPHLEDFARTYGRNRMLDDD